MTDPTLDLDAIERILSMARQDRIPYTAQILDTADALVAEVHRLRAQRDAALEWCDMRQRYIDEEEPDSLPVVWIESIRAALGVQPEPAEEQQ